MSVPYSHRVPESSVADMTTASDPAVTFAGVVAIDGPSGTGKSTVSRALARRLSARYLDSGAMYRAATLAVLRAGVDPQATEAVLDVVRRAAIEVGTDPAAPLVRLDGERVDAEIRSAAVTAAVSAVSALPDVRRRLVARQRELIAGATAVGLAGVGAIVVEGRDIGSVVWPQADLKVFLTASSGERARRRAAEEVAADVGAVEADLARRDHLDSSRRHSPLQKATGAVELDTTGLDVEQVVSRLVAMIDDA